MKRSHVTTALLLSILLLLPGASTLAGAQASAADPLAAHQELEENSFRLKSQGDTAEALNALREAFSLALGSAASQEVSIRRELFARAEIDLLMAFSFVEKLAGYDEFLAFLSDHTPADAPVLVDLMRYLSLHCCLSSGRIAEARIMRDALGFITTWHLIGPFENERGGGFDMVYGPETNLDLSAEHSGKERMVRWRPAPGVSPAGHVNLDALFKPNDQCLAYALCFLEAREAKTCALRLGSDEAVKVFCNGSEVFALEARRLRNFDQDVIPLNLRKGKNALLLKICDRTGQWGFCARLTENSGAPLEGVAIGLDPAGYQPPSSNAPPGQNASSDIQAPESSASLVWRGARDVFEEGAAAGRSRHHLYLGLLHHFKEYEGEDAQRASEHLETFLTSSPDHVPAHAFLAVTRQRRVEMAAEKNENPWRQGMQKTLELDPRNAESHYRLALYYTYSLWIPANARRHLEAALAINPAYFQPRFLQALHLRYTDKAVLSRTALLELARDPQHAQRPALLRELGRIALDEGRIDDAVALYGRALDRNYRDWSSREKLFKIAKERGDLPVMMRLLHQERELTPFRVSTFLNEAELALGGGDHEKAVELLQAAARINPDEDEVMRILGKAHNLAGRRKEALVAYDRALELNPKNDELRRYVEYLQESEVPFEELFAIDPIALIARRPAGDNVENAPHEYLLRQDVYKVNPDGTSSHYHHEVVRLLNEKGVKTYDYFYTLYAKDEQKARVKTARVIHPDGSISEAKIDNRELAQYEQGGYLPAFIDLPPVKTGDVVDLEYRIDDIKQSVFGNYFGLVHYFIGSDLQAVRESRLTLLLPEERTFRFNTRFLDIEPKESQGPDASLKVLTYALDDLQKVDQEPRMPGRKEFAPCVEVSTYQSWDEFAAWWWQLVDRQCDLSPAMEEKIAELTGDCTTERDKIRAVYNFVVSDIRYSDAWEFGIHGYKPYRASTIFNNRFGDCKDKAILIKSLLSHVGIEAHPVLIKLDRFRTEEDLTIPLVNHFNHAIAYVPEIDGGPGLFLDGTAQFHSMEALPDSDRGAAVVVVDGQGPTLHIIPYPRAESNLSHTLYDLTIDAQGGARLEVTESATGTNEAGIRQGYLNPGKRETRLKSTFGSVFGEVAVEKMEFSDVEDLNEPVRYTAVLHIDDVFLKSASDIQLKSVLFPNELGRLGAQDRRDTDLLLGAPHGMTTTTLYRLPKGFTVPTLPESVDLRNDYASYELSFTREGDAVRVERTLMFEAPRVPVEKYPRFRDFCRDVEKADEKMILVEET